jgi:C4-dicarboxylate-specific signal transduction histidine kinase
VAHEINNPLTVIVSRSNKLKNLLLKNEYDRAIFLKGIEQVNETALRIAKIIKSLKNKFAKSINQSIF